jgi:hypothetical protein
LGGSRFFGHIGLYGVIDLACPRRSTTKPFDHGIGTAAASAVLRRLVGADPESGLRRGYAGPADGKEAISIPSAFRLEVTIHARTYVAFASWGASAKIRVPSLPL